MKFLRNDPTLKQRRRELRRNQTETEKTLWAYLRNRQFYGMKFFRQYSIGPYILDFYCPTMKLAVELDGGQHNRREKKEYDATRTEYLKAQGINVIRFWDHEVLLDIQSVLAELTLKVTPPNLPFSKGEGKRQDLQKCRKNLKKNFLFCDSANILQTYKRQVDPSAFFCYFRTKCGERKRKPMNKKKTASSKRLSFSEDLIENLPIGMMLLDKKGKIIRMNKKQEEASQIEREKILGKTFEEAFPRTLEQGVKKPYYKLLRNGTSFDIIIDHYIPQYYSQQITYRARGAPFLSEKYFILLHEHAQELGQEKRLVEKRTKELQESKNFLESLIDSSPNIVISTDLSGRILIFNKTAETIFGYMEEEVLKKKIDCLFTGIQFNRGSERKNVYASKEVICVKKDQTTFPASIRISDIKNTRGKSIAKLCLLFDLTEKKEMEERLHLSEKLALYSELMGGIAHQLNNPLIGVVNFSEMLLKEMETGDPKKDLAETISKAGKECLRIITSVLNCIKDPYLTFSRTDIHEVLTNSLQALREQFGESLNDVSIKTGWDPDVSPILGDGIQLKQCFLNILTNAIQALQNGGSLQIETAYDKIKKEVKIIFLDTGTGIPKEYLNKIFLPFFSLQKNGKRHGLGLSFAYQIVKNHSGHINVESEVGLRSAFTITLPAS